MATEPDPSYWHLLDRVERLEVLIAQLEDRLRARGVRRGRPEAEPIKDVFLGD